MIEGKDEGSRAVIVGTHEIEMRLIFNIPAGVDIDAMKYKLAETVSVAIGMVAVLRETQYEVRPRASGPSLLS